MRHIRAVTLVLRRISVSAEDYRVLLVCDSNAVSNSKVPPSSALRRLCNSQIRSKISRKNYSRFRDLDTKGHTRARTITLEPSSSGDCAGIRYPFVVGIEETAAPSCLLLSDLGVVCRPFIILACEVCADALILRRLARCFITRLRSDDGIIK